MVRTAFRVRLQISWDFEGNSESEPTVSAARGDFKRLAMARGAGMVFVPHSIRHILWFLDRDGGKAADLTNICHPTSTRRISIGPSNAVLLLAPAAPALNAPAAVCSARVAWGSKRLGAGTEGIFERGCRKITIGCRRNGLPFIRSLIPPLQSPRVWHAGAG